METNSITGINTDATIALIALIVAIFVGLLLFVVLLKRNDSQGSRAYPSDDNSSKNSTSPLKKLKKKQVSNKQHVKYYTPVTQVTAIAKQLCDELKKENCIEFLKNDLMLPPLYLVPNLRDPSILTSLLRGILITLEQHLGLPDNLGFLLLSPYEHQEQDLAGAYKRGRLAKGITIYQKEWHTWPNLVAIMCHEITHHFAAAHNLELSDTEQNELRNDVLANLIGFHEYMADGYAEVEYPQCSGKVYHVGYITPIQCHEAYNVLSKVRSQI